MLYIVDMNKKYIKYIDYIVSDIEAPYFKYMKDNYGLKDDECVLVLSKIFNEPVTIKGRNVNDTNGNEIYYEYSNGYWIKNGYDEQGNLNYSENSDGYWSKYEYDTNGNEIYYEQSDGFWIKQEYDTNGNKIYHEDSDGYIRDNR